MWLHGNTVAQCIWWKQWLKLLHCRCAVRCGCANIVSPQFIKILLKSGATTSTKSKIELFLNLWQHCTISICINYNVKHLQVKQTWTSRSFLSIIWVSTSRETTGCVVDVKLRSCTPKYNKCWLKPGAVFFHLLKKYNSFSWLSHEGSKW